MVSQLFAAPWFAACKAPLSMRFSRQENWSGLSFPTPGDFPDSGIEAVSPALASGFFTTELSWKPCENLRSGKNNIHWKLMSRIVSVHL